MDIKGISVAFVYVDDMPRARKFYEESVGLLRPKIVTDRWVEYDLAGANFALHLRPPATARSDAVGAATTRFCFEVLDIRSAHQELTESGLKVHFGPRQEHGYHLLEFEDPDGNPVRLIQYEK